MRILTLIIVLLAGTSAFAAGDYYVWVDENGVTNYSQQNPTDQDARHVTKGHRFGERYDEPEPTGSRPGGVEAEDEAASDAAAAENKEKEDALIAKERAAIDAKIAETKSANCEIGKRNLAQLETFARVKVRGQDGEVRVLSEEEHQSQKQEARQLIEDNCNG